MTINRKSTSLILYETNNQPVRQSFSQNFIRVGQKMWIFYYWPIFQCVLFFFTQTLVGCLSYLHFLKLHRILELASCQIEPLLGSLFSRYGSCFLSPLNPKWGRFSPLPYLAFLLCRALLLCLCLYTALHCYSKV